MNLYRDTPYQWTQIVSGAIGWIAVALIMAFGPIGIESAAAQETSTVNVKSSEKKDSKSDETSDEIEDPPYEPKSKAELKRSLSSMQFKVTQSEGTEPAYRNKYWDNKKEGVYRCIVCRQALFTSETKYKSGTGWPSFFDPIDLKKVGFKKDFHLFYPRKEVHCSRCEAHLGHVFNDGPSDKTGKRYCMNSAALKFEERDLPKKKPE